MEYKNELLSNITALKECSFTPPQYSAKSFVETKYQQLEADKQAKIQEIQNQAQMEEQQRIAAVQGYNNEAQQYNSSLTNEIKKKHIKLRKYKKSLDNLFKHFNITPVSLDISDDATEDDINKMLDAAIEICKKYNKQRKASPITKYTDKLKQGDGIYSLAIFMLAIVFVYLLTPVIGIAYYANTIKNSMGIANDVEALKLARALMSEMDYKRFISQESYKELQELPEMTDIYQQSMQMISELPDYTEAHQVELQNAETLQNMYQELIEQATSTLHTRINDLVIEHQNTVAECEKKIEEFLSDYKPFPTIYSESAVLSHDFVFGRYNGTLDVTMSVPLKNIVFKYNDNDDYQIAVNRCKLYLANILLKVQPRKLDVTISDPLYQGADFTEFIIPEVSEYIKVVDTTFTESIENVRKVSLQNITKLHNNDIDEFNREAEEKGLVTIPYKLLIIASGIKHDEKGKTEGYDDKMKAYFAESMKAGILIWIIDTTSYVGTIEDKITNVSLRRGVPIEYTTELGEQAIMTFKDGIENFKPATLHYTKGFAERYIPKDKWWTWDTVKGIELNFGLADGDPSRGFPLVLGDDNVHALMGGATGAGKSAAINQMLVSLITKYPPSELNIIYIDFKNVEAAKFTRGVKDDGSYMSKDEMTQLLKDGTYFKRVSIIPHLSVISGTTDGAYALSLFRALNKEMQRRQGIINKYGKTKIQNVREDILKQYSEEHGGKKVKWHDMRQDWDWYKTHVIDEGLEIPRLLVICDEFQVMFNDKVVPPKIIDEITSLITLVTKLARAMCCHLWFTSQSMKGTLSNDTKANFSVRAALRSTSEVSTELLGNDIASKIKEKFGYMYTNDTAGQNKEANKLWRVPFLSDDEIDEYVSSVRELLEPMHEESHEAVFFDEKQLIPSYVIDEWYEDYPDTFDGQTTFIVGERADYSVNKAPVTMVLSEDANENVLVSGFNREDVLNNTLTLLTNLKHKNDVTVILNIADKNSYDLVVPENYVDESVKSLCNPMIDFKDMLMTVVGIVQSRIESGEVGQPIFVFLMFWEITGVFSGLKYSEEDAVKTALRLGPTVKVYFIFTMSNKMDMQTWVTKTCNHRLGAQNSKDTYFFIETTQVEKLPTNKADGNFAYYELGTKLNKFKIYQHEFQGSITEREVIL